MNARLLPLLAALALCAADARAQTAAPPAAVAAPVPVDDALYQALGAQPGLAGLVDEFVTRLVADPRTGLFFKHARQDHLKEMLVLQFCTVSGGGCAYTGRSIRETHQDMDISKGDFNAVVEVLQASMDARGIPFPTQNRLLARLAPMHRDIVTVH